MSQQTSSPCVVQASTRVSRFVDELIVALVNARVYRSDHPRVLASLAALPPILGDVLASSKDSGMTLAAVQGWLVYDGRPLLGASLAAPRLIAPLEARGSSGLLFDRDTTAADLTALIAVLLERPEADATCDTANAALERRGCQRIRFLPPYRAGEATGQFHAPDGSDGTLETHLPALDLKLYQRTVDLLQSVTIEVSQNRPVDFDATRTVVERILARLDQDPRALLGVSCYETYDAFTFGHSIRVALLALHFARALTSDKELLLRIGMAALLHDVGKAHVSFDVLHCRGRLSPEQRAEMEKHPALGAEILLESHCDDPAAVAAAFGHHRNLSGHGYPRTVHDADLPLITRIVKLCDVFESLTAARPYKPAMSPVRAFRIMLNMKGHFDPALLRRFIEVNGFYPNGSKVMLSDGRLASVKAQSNDVGRPVVEILPHEEDGAADEPAVVIDLSATQPAGCFLRVARLLMAEGEATGPIA